MTATKETKALLSRSCSGQHVHQQLEGGKRCRLAQQWPDGLCSAIIDGFVQSLDEHYTRVAFPAEAEHEDEAPDGAERFPSVDAIRDESDLAVEDNTNYQRRAEDEEAEVMRLEGPPRPHESQEAEALQKRRELWRKLPYNQRVALRRLHHMTGHASTASMQRLLRTAGADPAAVKAMNYFHCPACEHQLRPGNTHTGEYKFNDEISLDTFIVKDSVGDKFKVMSIVCQGTLFHAAFLVGEVMVLHLPKRQQTC